MAESNRYRVHPLAWKDIDDADAWYFERSPDSGDAFIFEVSVAIQTICEAPQRWPKYLYGTRRFLLHRSHSQLSTLMILTWSVSSPLPITNESPDIGKLGFNRVARTLLSARS